ncbi:neutral/alkaline non-lysosomal ceramidase N-terminal domain-containing protein [Amycolatopsis orientalis]|uniref:neutral/alkaline non-lysosomal ceramidase N-terminal domain-containing protein n=1 Tax=Amycolatopsis orientalis TaxID=31958 RepID=UPI001268D74E|nr:neutral/alkaline non-lysosomal ceramidase N-terminal domain-containing protein [Amycolatopsis orientalis]
MEVPRRPVLKSGVMLAGYGLAAPWLQPGRADAAATPLAIAVGKVDITPGLGIALAGYAGDSPRAATGVNRPLYARCTIIWDAGIPNVIVTADILAFPRTIHQAIRTRITALGVASSDFVLTATHTHNGPVINDDVTAYTLYNIADPSPERDAIRAYVARLQDQIVDLVRETLTETPTACTLDYQVADEDFSYNREGLSSVERDLPVLVARTLDGAPIAVLFGYGCHPVSGPGVTLIDPDYPGLAVSVIEDDAGIFAQFLTGTAGDQNPRNASSWPALTADGTDLGQTVLNTLSAPGRPISGPILTAYRDVDIKLDITDTPDNLAVARANFAVRQANSPGWISRHAEIMINQIDAHSFTFSTPVPVQVWRFAGGTPLRMVMIGGEPVSGYAAHCRDNYGGSDGIWISGYAGEVPAYLPSDELLTTGGALHYACGWSTDYPGMGGGAMCAYGLIAHYLRNTQGNGVEHTLIAALTAML